MAVFVVCMVLLLAMACHSDASYCVCNSAFNDTILQKNIDYACGNGADCSAIHSNGPCFSPNTVKDHCNYAVNSYYQRKGQVQGSCDFSGTATVTPNAPNAAPGCVYQSSPSNGGSTSPPSSGGTPPPPNGNSSTPGTFPGSSIPPGSFVPPGNSFDNRASVTLLSQSIATSMIVWCFLTFLISGLMFPRI